MNIGHQKNITYLEHILKNNTLVGSFLFYGKEHLGKTTVAEWFIKKLLENENLANHPDLIRLSPPEDEKTGKKSAISVETLREVLPKLNSSPLASRHNVLLIEGAEYINEEGWNLLLKTLEEPSRSAIIILVAHNIEQIPKTVLSRVLKLQFLAVPEAELRDGLKFNKVAMEKAEPLIPLALGRPGVIIEAAGKRKVAKDETNELVEALDQSFAHRLNLFEKTSKDEMMAELDRLLLVCRDAVLLKNDCAAHLVFPALKEKTSILSARYNDSDWYTLMKKILESKDHLMHNANPRLVMESVLFSI